MSKKRKCHFNDNLKKEFEFIKIVDESKNDSLVKCTVCNVEFNIAVGGRSSISKHIASNKHKNSLTASSVSHKVTDFMRSTSFREDEKNLALAEGITAYHSLRHNHSFRSMDCTSKLNRILYNKKFHCARTKGESIIRNVFLPYAKDNLKTDLEQAKFVTILSDASNHKETKLYPVLIRYFNCETGIQIKILTLDSINGETSEILSNYLEKTINDHNLNNKVIAICADNTNTNFGGVNRKGDNNVYAKMNVKLQKTILGVGCNAHIVSNCINIASSLMSIDVEVVIPQIYLHFERFTVRVTSLKTFCEEATVEYKKLLGYSKTRWLALMPAIERILQLYQPLSSYFLSLEKCPLLLKNFFKNDSAEVTLYFIHSQATLFQSTIKIIEKRNITFTEVGLALIRLKEQLQTRLDSKFLPLFVHNKLNHLEESNPGIKKKFFDEAMRFYQNSLDYLKKWTKHDEYISVFNWVLLREEINWNHVFETVSFVKNNFDVVVNDNLLFDEVHRINNIIKDKTEWSEWEIDKKWINIFSLSKKLNIPLDNIKILIEIALCLPGTNAQVERTFSICNDIWTIEKSRLSVEMLAAMTIVKMNINEDCTDFLRILEDTNNNCLLKKIHSNDKYM